MAMYGDTSIDMMLNVLPGSLTGIFALNAGLSSINQQFQNMTKAVDNHFGIVDATIVSATALVLQFAKGSADAFGEYEQGMKIVQAVSGQSSAAITELGQKASEFSVQYRTDISDLTEGLQTLGRAGLKSASEQTEVLESGLQTAKLEGRDLNSVLEELIQNTALLGGNLKSNNFGEQSEYVNDLLVATSMTAPINTHDVSETLKYSGGIAAAAGANIETTEGKEILEDYMGAIAAFAQKGVKGSIAGTALRAFFNKPATQDSSVLEGLSMIGLKPEYLWEDDQETMKPISEQISLIQSQMKKKGISKMDQLQIWSKIVGGKMGQQMMKLEGSDIREITKDIQEANSAENLATQSMQTYQASMKQTSEAAQLAYREFGEHVARFLTPISQALTPILQFLSNPAASTAFFAGFLKMLSLAWNSIKKVFAGVKSELGIIKAEFRSLVLNQPQRRGIMDGRMWGGGTLAREVEEVKKVSSETTKVKQEVSMATSIGNQGTASIVSKLEHMRSNLSAAINRTKENVIEINEKLSSGISVVGQKSNQVISETSNKIKGEYTSATDNIINTAKAKIDSGISSSASKMKTEFQAALNSLTYTPHIKKGPGAKSVSNIQYYKDVGSKSFGFYNKLEEKAKKIEDRYSKEMIIAKGSRGQNLLDLENTLRDSKSPYIKRKLQLEDEMGYLKKNIDKYQESIKKYDSIISSNVSLSTKTEARVARDAQVKELKLYEQEYSLKQQELSVIKTALHETQKLIDAIREERLAVLKMSTQNPIIPPSGGKSGHVNMNDIPKDLRPYLNSPEDIQGYSFKKYGYNVGTYPGIPQSLPKAIGVMPGLVGTLDWNNIPKEYRPDLFGGNYSSWKFKKADSGQEMLAYLRSNDIAMSKETQEALKISNKELIRFYEELIQVNAALAKTTAIENGKITTRNGMTAEQEYQNKIANDTLYKTEGNLVPIRSTGQQVSQRQLRGLNALFGDTQGKAGQIFEKEFKESRRNIENKLDKNMRDINQISRYSLPQGVISENQINSNLLNKNSLNLGQQIGGSASYHGQVTRRMIEDSIPRKTFKEKFSSFTKGLSGGSKGLKGLGNAVGKVTDFMGGKFFAAMMVIDIVMQVYTALHNEYIKKVEEATNKIEEMTQAVSDAENVFFQGRDEEGLPKITGWSEEHPDATAEEKEDALLGAYSEIYDHSREGLSALDANTQQLAIATEELKIANQGYYAYMEDKNFGPKGRFSEPFRQDSSFSEDFGEDGSLLKEAAVYLSDLVGKPTSSYVDKYGTRTGSVGASFMETGEIHLDDWQKAEEFPWSTEFAPILASDIWKAGSGKDGIKVMLGDTGFKALSDQYSSLGSERKLTGVHGQGGTISAYDQSAWNIHGQNLENNFADKESQNKLQMGLKNFSKDFSKLAKQTRRFEKATGKTALGSLQNEMKKTKNMRQALKNLQVTDPKLVNYIKSLAIKTGMDEQQVLMAAQLQQLQDMQEIANTQITPRMESVVGLAYQQVAYGGQTLGEVGSSGAGAVSAAQNAAAIAALLNAKMETSLDERGYKQWIKEHPNEEDPYGDAAHFAAARDAAHDDGVNTEMDKYYEDWAKSYAATNFMMYNPDLNSEDAAKRAEEWYKGVVNSSVSATYDTLRKGGIGALKQNILSAYDASLDQEEGGGSGGGGGSGSGSGDNDKNTGTRRERVDLVLCSKKEIPKLNVNLFKKPPSFTILNKNFKLRDVKINSEDKPKAIMAAIKNSFIDIQKRTDPKIIQDEDAVYDPKAATDGTNVPSGSAKTKTDNNS